jgi:hypothetical protein
MMKQQCNQISNGCLEKFQKISLLAVAILFSYTFFNLIWDATRKVVLLLGVGWGGVGWVGVGWGAGWAIPARSVKEFKMLQSASTSFN